MTLSRRPILLHVGPSDEVDSATSARANALSNGFDGVEIALPDVEEPTIVRPAADGAVIAVAATCQSTDVESGLAEVSALLRLAATCRATCLNLTLPPVDGCEGGAGFSRYQDGLNFAYRVLYDLRHEAEGAGVAIAIEAATGGGLLSPVELGEIINQANSPAVGVCLDVTRVSRVGVVEDWIATLGYRVKSVRVELLDERELDTLADALAAAGYDGPVIVQGTDDPDRLRAAVARLAGAA
ncbi:MAG: TIM barrel protein [Planctomycetes bacterium]|nr:TIM barrel protein [Planctomycetota bacterium]